MSEIKDKTAGKILIVEDDSTLMRGLRDNFINKGYQVFCAMDGESALEQAKSINPDLVLLDIMLPKLNGYTVCEELRLAEMSMPIIMLSAKGQEQDVVRGLTLGADDYVCKPFSIVELLARVNAFMRRHNQTKETSIEFGQFRLNLDSRKFFSNDQEIKLTPKEFGLLELFCKRPGRALTRETILNIVWGRGLLTTSRSVDRCVNTLRKKIESDTQNPKHILSIRDIGYRFEK